MSVQGDYLYDAKFYSNTVDRVLASARRILPPLIKATGATSVVDLGCGWGLWLATARECGVDDVLGIDGPHARKGLHIDQRQFLAHDLTKPLRVGRRFGLAISVEVGEHIDAACADGLVGNLVRLAPTVLFSAAIPGQGGAHHVNEQWPCYWIDLFAQHGYTAVDCIRRRVWDDPQVQPWYAQNAFLMVDAELAQAPGILALATQSPPLPVRCVHPRLFEARTDPRYIQQMAVLTALPAPLRRAAYRGRSLYRRLSRRSR